MLGSQLTLRAHLSLIVAAGVLSQGILSPGAFARNYVDAVDINGGNKFITILGGTYLIGSPEEEKGHQPDETLQQVTLSSYEISETPVTQESYALVMGSNPSWNKRQTDCPDSFKVLTIKENPVEVCSDYPVENVNWDQANQYINLVNKIDSKFIYRLPTEAQQEVAFRGGKNTEYFSGDDAAGMSEYNKWPQFRYVPKKTSTHSVKSMKPNDYGIYWGVWEWSSDWYHEKYQEASRANPSNLDPTGPASGTKRVLRGFNARSAYRCPADPNLNYTGGNVGFRLTRTLRNAR